MSCLHYTCMTLCQTEAGPLNLTPLSSVSNRFFFPTFPFLKKYSVFVPRCSRTGIYIGRLVQPYRVANEYCEDFVSKLISWWSSYRAENNHCISVLTLSIATPIWPGTHLYGWYQSAPTIFTKGTYCAFPYSLDTKQCIQIKFKFANNCM